MSAVEGLCFQEQLRDDPLTSLQAPVLFVRGTNDNFCEERIFEAIKGRMTSPLVEVNSSGIAMQIDK
jgi:predicted alpha/beta-hydrolase family hydrolase